MCMAVLHFYDIHKEWFEKRKKIYDLVMICNVYVINFISNMHF